MIFNPLPQQLIICYKLFCYQLVFFLHGFNSVQGKYFVTHLSCKCNPAWTGRKDVSVSWVNLPFIRKLTVLDVCLQSAEVTRKMLRDKHNKKNPTQPNPVFPNWVYDRPALLGDFITSPTPPGDPAVAIGETLKFKIHLCSVQSAAGH